MVQQRSRSGRLPLFLRAIGTAQARMATAVSEMTPQQLNEYRDRLNAARTSPRNRWLLGKPHPDVRISNQAWDTDAGIVHVRVYTPSTATRKPGLVMCFHGGGFVAGFRLKATGKTLRSPRSRLRSSSPLIIGSHPSTRIPLH
jgi:hypothetical protein